MLSAQVIVELHDQRTSAWHEPQADFGEDAPMGANAEMDPQLRAATDWLYSVSRQYRGNFEL